MEQTLFFTKKLSPTTGGTHGLIESDVASTRGWKIPNTTVTDEIIMDLNIVGEKTSSLEAKIYLIVSDVEETPINFGDINTVIIWGGSLSPATEHFCNIKGLLLPTDGFGDKYLFFDINIGYNFPIYISATGYQN